MCRYSILLILLLVACGGGDGELVVIGDQDARDDSRGLDVADMNGDGLSDLVVAGFSLDENKASHGWVRVYLQRIADPGTFAAPVEYSYGPVGTTPTELRVADLIGTSLPDVVATGYSEAGFRVMLQDTTRPGTLLPPSHYGDAGATVFLGMIAVADIDVDMVPDVVLAGGGELAYYPQDGGAPGSFLNAASLGDGNENVAIGRINPDVLNDIVTFGGVSDAHEDVLYYRHNPNAPGQFLTPIMIPIGFSGSDVGIADVTSDGRPDLVISGLDAPSQFDLQGIFTILEQTPTGDFVQIQTLPLPGSVIAKRLALADLEGDGDIEVIIGLRTPESEPNRLEIFYRGFGGSYQSGAVLTIPNDQAVTLPEIYSVKVEDLNGDLMPDVAVTTNELFIFFQNQGQPGTFSGAVRVAGQR